MDTIQGFINLGKYMKRLGKSSKDDTNGVADYFLSKRSEPPKRDSKQWLDMYNKNPRFSPVTKMSLDIATTRGKVVRVDKSGKEEEVKDHPLLDLLYKPNEEYHITGTASLYLSQVYFLLKGESFGIIERDLLNQPKYIWFIPPHWVTLPSSEQPDHYTVNFSSGYTAYVQKEDMFYRKNPNPSDPTGRGVGRVESLGDEIETDEYMAKFAKRFFFNDATPNIVITAPEGTQDDEIKQAERKWYQKFGGFLNSSKAAFLNWEAKLHVLNTSNREMDFIESRKFYRDLVIQHFGIPPEIMGNVENSNKATVVAARDIYRNEVLDTMFIEFEEAITHQLLKQYKDSSKLKFVFNREKEDKTETVIKLAEEGFKNGGLTLKEYRKVMGDVLGYDLEDINDDYGNSISRSNSDDLVNIKEPRKEEPVEDNNNEDKNYEGGKDTNGQEERS